MYLTVRDPLARGSHSRQGPFCPRTGYNVLFLGLTSLFTDASSEMLAAVLPLYFVLELRLNPFQFGLLEGLYQGLAALVRVVSGLVADVQNRYKAVAVSGYGLSVASRGLLFVAGTAWWPIAGALAMDRIGKGLRTAPRDALITLSSEEHRLGEAFGLHRSLDTVGALVGPVLALLVLFVQPGGYDVVFVVSMALALVGLAVIALLVTDRRSATVAPVVVLSHLVRSVVTNARLRRLLVVGASLGTATTTDALIYLLLVRGHEGAGFWFPLLFVGTALSYLILALPLGRLADRLGRYRTFVAGHLAIVAIYLLLLMCPEAQLVTMVLGVALLGAYYAATDGVLSALASSILKTDELTTGLALASTTWALARLFSAVLFGWIWSLWGATTAVATFLTGLIIVVVVATVFRRWLNPGAMNRE